LAYNGATWVSTNVFNDFIGVTSFTDGNWSITPSLWNNNRKYRVQSRAKHEINGLVETPASGNVFIIDDTPPSLNITQPDKAYVINVPTLTASITDIAPGTVVSAYFRVKKQGLSEYWNWQASTFTALSGSYTDLTANLVWDDILKTGVASYTTDYFQTGLAFEKDKTYTVQVYSNDKAGNLGIASEFNFTIDRSSPSAIIQIPLDANKSGMRYLPLISGTATDDKQNSQVQIAIQQWGGSPNLWFNGTGFLETQVDPYWIDVNISNGFLSPSATAYVYSPSGLDSQMTPGTSGLKYLILVRALDSAGNVEENFTVDVDSMVISMDKAAPSSTIVFPADDANGISGRYKSANAGKAATNTRIRGQAFDNVYSLNNAGISASIIRLSYLDGATTYYWNGSAFVNISSDTAWLATNLTLAHPNADWTYLPDITWAGDREYTIEVLSEDDAKIYDDSGSGNKESALNRPSNLRKFIIDDTPPAVAITTPSANVLNVLNTVYGTSSDNLAGFNYSEIRISTGSVGSEMYWNGSGWQTTEFWMPVSLYGPSSWYYTVDQTMLVDDRVYRLEARGYDYAGNISTVYSTYTFTYDTTGPIVSITYPQDAKTYSSVLLSTPMAGTSSNSQTSPNTGVSSVTVAITDLTNNTCFNGAFFVGCASSIWLYYNAGTLDLWQYNDPDISFTSDHRYKYEARAIDQVGNPSSIASVIVNFDLENPTSTVNNPSTEYVNSWTSISGYASDERNGERLYEAKLGTYTVKAAIKLQGGSWWGGSGFDSIEPVWFEASVDTTPYSLGQATVSWVYNFPPNLQNSIVSLKSQTYWTVTYAYDLALNKEFGPAGSEPVSADIPAQAGRIIKFDNDVPVALTTMPVNASYMNNVPVLYGVATDTGVIMGVKVLVKARGNYNSVWNGGYTNSVSDWDDTVNKYSHWINANYSNGSWWIALPSLLPVNNSKLSVWAIASDLAGNESPMPSNGQIDLNLNPDNSAAYYFTYDSSSPVTYITYPDKPAIGASTNTITGTAFDPNSGGEPSGVLDVRIKMKRSDSSYWHFGLSNWSAMAADDFGVTGTVDWYRSLDSASQEDGYQYNIYTFARDNAGNNNDKSLVSTFTFTVDFTTPTSQVTFPSNNSFLSGVSALQGMADDSVENIQSWTSPRNFESGINSDGVEVSLMRLSDEKWWDGVGFNSASRVWNKASFVGVSSGTWTYNLPPTAITDGTTYYAISRAVDIVGNIQTVYTTNFFTGDTTRPVSISTYPTGNVENVNSIGGTASDTLPGELRASGSVIIALRRTDTIQCYDPMLNTFTSCPGPSLSK